MANNDSIGKTITVALLLCVVCSVVVSTAAVLLKPLQETNKSLDFKRNILSAAGLLREGVSIEEQFKQITPKLVDLNSGRFYSDSGAAALAVDSYDQRKAAKDPELSEKLAPQDDIAKISRREKYAKVYLVEDGGVLQQVILPIKGYGLWSTLYGFLALKADTNTVVGLGFYEQGETPGLGGEVDNPLWKSLWKGKQVYADDGSVAIKVIKGTAAHDAVHKVDGLSGATLTSRGVDNLMHFWLGENGYGPFLARLKRGEA